MWSALFRAANAAGRMLRRLGVWRGEPKTQELVRAARKETGLQEFGDPPVRPALERLVRALRGARLTPLGRVLTRRDLLRLLSNRLQLQADRARHPEMEEEEIRSPLVILGLPRTGTTLLHGLLSRDPESLTPRTWEVMYPSPPPRRDVSPGDSRIRAVERRLRWFDRLVPEYKVAHPYGARLPQECMEILSHTFLSPRFHRSHHLPDYADRLYRETLDEAYRFHRRFLRHLQWGADARRWVLKNPPHLHWIETVDRVYPDARYVHTHRDPLRAMASYASHNRRLRRAFLEEPVPVGAVRSARRWARSLERVLEHRRRRPGAEDRFVDVRYVDLLRDPVAVVRKIYRFFDLRWPRGFEERLRGFLAEHPRDEHGVHRYGLEEYGLDRDRHTAIFDAYLSAYEVGPVPEPWPDA